MGNSASLADPYARDKLVKLLGLLGSEHAGERDAAGLAAHRLITRIGLTWGQMIAPPSWDPSPDAWLETVHCCLTVPGLLRTWETDFLRSLANFPRISRKQRTVLDGIAARVLGDRS